MFGYSFENRRNSGSQSSNQVIEPCPTKRILRNDSCNISDGREQIYPIQSLQLAVSSGHKVYKHADTKRPSIKRPETEFSETTRQSKAFLKTYTSNLNLDLPPQPK